MTAFNEGLLYERVSTKKKQASDFKYIKDKAQKLISLGQDPIIQERNKRWAINYRLHKGLGITEVSDLYYGMPNQELYKNSTETFIYNDIISPVSKGILGEQQGRPLNAVVIDNSQFSAQFRKREKQSKLKNIFAAKYYTPIQVAETQKYFIENGITDPYSLDPEQRKQMEADLGQRIQQATPEEVKKELSSVNKSPMETQGQQLLGYLMNKERIKFKTDVGFEHGLCTNLEAYRITERNGEPVLDNVQPIGLIYDMSPSSFFLTEADWITYTEEQSFIEILQTLGEHLKVSLIRKLEGRALFSGEKASLHPHFVSLVNYMSQHEDYFNTVFQRHPINTRQGQEILHSLESTVGRQSLTVKIPVTHVNVKLPRKFYYVEHYTKDGIEVQWYNESYVSDPRRDKSVMEYWGVQAYETTYIGDLGTDAGVFVKTRDIPWQYPSINNPFLTRMNYYGAEYSRLLGDQDPMSVIDLGKAGSYKYNLQNQRLNKAIARDKGKIFVMTPSGMPDNWDESQWLDMVKDDGILMLDESKLDPQQLANLFRSIDLGQDNKIADMYGMMEKIKSDTTQQMYYNQARLGLSGERSAVGNNQQDINQSTTQTRFLFYLHDHIVESVLNGIVNMARIAYKDNPVKATYVLDDMSVIDLDVDTEMLAMSEYNVFVTHMGEDPYVVNIIRNQALALLQTSSIDFGDYARVMRSKSLTEIVSIAEDAVKKAEARRQEDIAIQQDMMKRNQDFQAQLANLKANAEMAKVKLEQDTRRYVAEVGSMQLANQADINRNKVSDIIEKANKDIAYKEKKDREDRKLKREELLSKERIAKDKATAKQAA